MLARVAPRLVSFEEQVAAVREALAALHERQEDWAAAAQTLAGIDLDSGRPLQACCPLPLSTLAAVLPCAQATWTRAGPGCLQARRPARQHWRRQGHGQWPAAVVCSWSTLRLCHHAADLPTHAGAGLRTHTDLQHAWSCMKPPTVRMLFCRCAAGGARV
jgi:hypothetical protein